MKKGQGLSMNVIIIAALALLVLVVLTIMFLGRTATFGEASVDCQQQGGTCATICGQGDAEGFNIPYTPWKCQDETLACCIKGG